MRPVLPQWALQFVAAVSFDGEHGLGKLIVDFALRAAITNAPAFAQRIKSAVEAA